MNPSTENESQPLLPQSPIQADSPSPTWTWTKSNTAALRQFISREETPILLCTFALYFLASFAKHVIEVPFIALLERTICTQYYRHNGNPTAHDRQEFAGRLCKVVPVQDKLATVTGWKFSFDAVPGLLTAILYGSFADKFGRKPVLFLFSTGMMTSLIWIVLVCYANEAFPVETVWASSIFIFMGGGQRVLKSMLFTIVADTVDRSHRTRYMYLLSSIPHLVTLIAPPFANLFMRMSIWLPFEVACGLLLVSYLIIWAMPESLRHRLSSEPPVVTAIQTVSPTMNLEPQSHEEPLLRGYSGSRQSDHSTQNSWMNILGETIAFFRVPTLPSVFLLFLLKPIALISKAFTYQFASESFRWEMSQTTWLRVSQAAGSAIVTMIFLPLLSALLIRRGFRAKKLDLGAIRGSLCIAVLGFAMLWQARASWMLVVALFICGLSEGLEPALQGLATSLIDGVYNARMFTTLAVVETIAKLIGGPLMARLFSIGRSPGGHGSSGINFLTSSIIFVLLEIIAWTINMKQ